MPDLNQEINELKKRVDKLEMQIAFLLRNRGIEYPEPVAVKLSPDILALLEQGKGKEAIKLFREETGAGLKDAKRIIDSYKKK